MRENFDGGIVGYGPFGPVSALIGPQLADARGLRLPIRGADS
jgi:hypothetical protein